jgi:hypothetical protein
LNETETNTRSPIADLPPDKAVRIAVLKAQLERTLARDALILAAVVRALKSPRGTARIDAEAFAEFVRGIVREELAR